MQVGSFEIDRADVLAELERFCGPEQVRVDHSLFGPMSLLDWMRWDIFTRIIISGSSGVDLVLWATPNRVVIELRRCGIEWPHEAEIPVLPSLLCWIAGLCVCLRGAAALPLGDGKDDANRCRLYLPCASGV